MKSFGNECFVILTTGFSNGRTKEKSIRTRLLLCPSVICFIFTQPLVPLASTLKNVLPGVTLIALLVEAKNNNNNNARVGPTIVVFKTGWLFFKLFELSIPLSKFFFKGNPLKAYVIKETINNVSTFYNLPWLCKVCILRYMLHCSCEKKIPNFLQFSLCYAYLSIVFPLHCIIFQV